MLDYKTQDAYNNLAQHNLSPSNAIGIYCMYNTELLRLILTELNKLQQAIFDLQAIAGSNEARQTLTDRVGELAERVKNLEQSSNLFSVC